MAYLQVPPYDARAIANYFLELSKRDGKPLDPMKIQKLVYLAHGWNLAIHDKPLINERIEAWKYGPVIRSVYSAFAHVGSRAIEGPAFDAKFVDGKFVLSQPRLENIEDPSNADVRALLEEIWKVYGGYSGIQLSNYTHQPGSPWEQTWKPNVRGLVIEDHVIQRYFKALANKANERT